MVCAKPVLAQVVERVFHSREQRRGRAMDLGMLSQRGGHKLGSQELS